MTKIEIKSIFGSVLFTHECENNTIKTTLEEAVKQNANLENAYLYNANLKNAYLGNAKLPVFCKWTVTYSFDFKKIKIGCKEKTIQEWDNWFNSSEEYSTKRGTDDFKRIFANYSAVKAYCIEMTK